MKNNFFLPKNFQRKMKEKRGKGEGSEYTPYFEVHEVPSAGRSLRVKGCKTGRIHHLLSDLESNFFFALEWNPNITDIREQFPLDFQLTLKIARELNTIHPRNTRTKEIHIMTTDFVVNFDNVIVAYACKYKKDLDNKRTLQKLEIERLYWERQGIKFEIITEEDIPMVLVKNVRSIHHARDIAWLEHLLSTEDRYYIENYFKNLLQRNKSPLSIANQIDKNYNLPVGSAMFLFRHFIANRIINIDMSQKIDVTKQYKLEGEKYVLH